ncbi:fasciclin-1 isoform X3 [Linepithema humile]|uniref:fasciclin-1 isoform X3 n=1 Tax=Linepithema humile TaxID=83485 RepID=UPI00351EDE8B
MLTFLLAAALVVAKIHATHVSMDAKIRDDSNLSQFYQLLEGNQVANTTLSYRHVTVFAPTNRAFQKYSGNTKNLVLYHISNRPLKIEVLPPSISSELEGNPPLWITKTKDGTEVYINNAKILMEYSNFVSKLRSQNGDVMIQVLHIINEVLEPVYSTSVESPIYNPDALMFLNQSEHLNLGDHRVRTFRQRIIIEKKESIYKIEGRYTFFIPVDEGFKPVPRPQKIDSQVIDGHVIPGEVLFTAPTPEEIQYPTLAFSDNLKVTVSFSKKRNKVYVKSNTITGDTNHPTGAVLAEIVKANIPVRNGVVHLIQRPLMVIDSTIKDFLESFKEKEDGPVFKFYELIRDYGENIMNIMSMNANRPQYGSVDHGVTLFAPNNEALEQMSVKQILQDKRRIKEILELHFVREKLSLDMIKNRSISLKSSASGKQQLGLLRRRLVASAHVQVPYSKHSFGSWPEFLQVQTVAQKKKLYFNVAQGPNGEQIVTVEGGGVNATIVTDNIAATNGYVHIINRVLGVPYTTVLDKLRSDPMLNSTYFLGQRRGFNDQLNDTTKRFTYFAPRDFAWKNAGISFPSTTKKLFMPEYSYHTKQILERHLVIAEQAYTMAKLKEMSNDTLYLPAARDNLKLRVREQGENYQVQWDGKWVQIFRPDVECTNGIIHVIDTVFLKDSDVRVTGGASLATLAPHLIMILIAKWQL